jgi:hypothetical protein
MQDEVQTTDVQTTDEPKKVTPRKPIVVKPMEHACFSQTCTNKTKVTTMTFKDKKGRTHKMVTGRKWLCEECEKEAN